MCFIRGDKKIHYLHTQQKHSFEATAATTKLANQSIVLILFIVQIF